MAFKMKCPKCHTGDYSITRDNRTFGAVAQAFELVFHCRCGKQMFGKMVLEQYEMQKKAWEAERGVTNEETSANNPSAPDHLAASLEHRKNFEEKQKRAAEENARKKKEQANLEWQKKVKPTDGQPKAKTSAEPSGPQEVGVNKCAWHQCDKMARKNSKYCSRACSNKNARHRHKQRQKT